MSVQLRFVSRMVCTVAFGLMALLPGLKAHAQSVTITSFSATGYPGGYDDVTDTVNLSLAYNNIPSAGGYGYGIIANVLYYSGPYASGTLLQSVSRAVYSNGGSLSPGNTNVPVNVNLNTPAILRAAEPAGTQSILYVYSVQAGGGCSGWSGNVSASTWPNFLVRG